MNTAITSIEPVEKPTTPTPAAAPPSESDAANASEHVLFGRLRWWFDESPMAFTAAAAMALVTIGFIFIFTVRALQADSPLASVTLQAVQAESVANDAAPLSEQTMEFQQLSAASAEAAERVDEKVELPELPKTDPRIKPNELLGNLADSDKQLQETAADLRRAGELLKILEKNQNRGQGDANGNSGRGAGQLDPNSTPGRMARWVISYPTIPQSDYEKMLDFFRIELAYLQSDRKTMQYLANLGGAGKKHLGAAADEERMFWYWMGQNRLRELDDAILRKHGLEASSEVVHLYSKDLERRLSDMEKEYLRRQFKTGDVDKIAQTNYRIVGGPGGWHLEVTSIVLR